MIELFKKSDYDYTIERINKVKKQLIIVSSIFVVIAIILSILLIKNYGKVYVIVMSILSIAYSIYLVNALKIQLNRLSAYKRLLYGVFNGTIDEYDLVITEKIDGIISLDGLGYRRYKGTYFYDKRKEKIISIEESIENELEVGKHYKIYLHGTALVSYEEVHDEN